MGATDPRQTAARRKNLRPLLILTVLSLLCGWWLWFSTKHSERGVVSVLGTWIPASDHRLAKALQQEAWALQLQAMAQRRWQACEMAAAWVPQYARRHASMVAEPSDAKFMLHICSGPTSILCAGIGDRIRAMMETLKLAQFANRAVLFRWTEPSDLEEVLQPAAIDWRVGHDKHLEGLLLEGGRGTNSVNYVWSTWRPWSNTSAVPPEFVDGTFAGEQAKLISVTSNFLDQRGMLRGPNLGKLDSDVRSCLFQALFKPSRQLSEQVHRMKRQLFGAGDVPYVAIHLRVGSFDGEWRPVERFQPFTGLLAALACAKALAAARGITAPVLLLTDNAMLREHLQAGLLEGVVTTPYKATHVLNPEPWQGREALMSSFLDLALLAGAHCFIGSPSGFTHVAQLWGRHSCFMQVQTCMQQYSVLPSHSCSKPPCWL